ncbi:glycoside hydrolase superfamily [Phakopsora pachyrhizi]|uniref:cellulase n=1 Tax=Phakopsora pachyrhizi TaxID=170000 RepID=A0AAV0BC50_PHAPC|nr:glycoside hydrolase superfamily [Phakopsora pachyrhizi]CAH7684271.1 glycoside hydrolase superfamily [Phakopsora pachyrhizi]
MKNVFLSLSTIFFVNLFFGSYAKPLNSSSDSSVKLPYFLGVNLAGFEFGIDPWNSHPKPMPPSDKQIPHFVKQGVNIIRVPMAWELIQPQLSKELDSKVEAQFAAYIKKITTSGTYAIIDIHNYARNRGSVVTENIPSEAFVDLWVRLAKVFSSDKLVYFGLMNEPHDIQSWDAWTKSLQDVVTGIRKAGAKNVILLPGEQWSSLKTDIFTQSYQRLKTITNPDKTFDGISFEFHRYFDSDGSGKSTECSGDRVEEVKAAAKILNADGRQAIITETGAGSTQSCLQVLPKFFGAIKESYPAIAGGIMWGAGSFDTVPTYELLLTKLITTSQQSSEVYEDQENWKSIKQFLPKSSNSTQ